MVYVCRQFSIIIYLIADRWEFSALGPPRLQINPTNTILLTPSRLSINPTETINYPTKTITTLPKLSTSPSRLSLPYQDYQLPHQYYHYPNKIINYPDSFQIGPQENIGFSSGVMGAWPVRKNVQSTSVESLKKIKNNHFQNDFWTIFECTSLCNNKTIFIFLVWQIIRA